MKEKVSEFLGIDKEELLKFSDLHSKDLTIGKIKLIELYNLLAKKFNLKNEGIDIFNEHLRLYKNFCTERDKNIINLIKKLKEYYKVVSID